jgi:hypothetical protein
MGASTCDIHTTVREGKGGKGKEDQRSNITASWVGSGSGLMTVLSGSRINAGNRMKELYVTFVNGTWMEVTFPG